MKEAERNKLIYIMLGYLGKNCEICGDIGFKEAIITCNLCKNVDVHQYCMLGYYEDTPVDWCCEECDTSKGVMSKLRGPENEASEGSKDFLKYLSSRDCVVVAKHGDETNMYLVPPSDFIRKVLKVDGLPCLYGVVLKSAPSGTLESYQPRAPELTASQIAQARLLLTSDIIESKVICSHVQWKEYVL